MKPDIESSIVDLSQLSLEQVSAAVATPAGRDSMEDQLARVEHIPITASGSGGGARRVD